MPSSKTVCRPPLHRLRHSSFTDLQPRSFGHGRAGGQAAEPYPTSPEVRKSVRLQVNLARRQLGFHSHSRLPSRTEPAPGMCPWTRRTTFPKMKVDRNETRVPPRRTRTTRQIVRVGPPRKRRSPGVNAISTTHRSRRCGRTRKMIGVVSGNVRDHSWWIWLFTHCA